MEKVIQPARAAQPNRKRPMNDGVGLIIFASETRKLEAAVSAVAGERIGQLGKAFGLHERRIEPGNGGCHDIFDSSRGSERQLALFCC